MLTTMRVRWRKVRLPGGEVEGVGTDVRAARRSPAAEFKTVSGWRWNHEPYPERIKKIFAIERCSGKSVQALKHDFSGVSFWATVESSLSKPAPAAVTAQGQARAWRTAPQVTRAGSSVTVLDPIVQLWGDPPHSPASTLAAIERRLLTSPTRHRPGRQFPRHKRSAAFRLRFAKYGKRIVA